MELFRLAEIFHPKRPVKRNPAISIHFYFPPERRASHKEKVASLCLAKVQVLSFRHQCHIISSSYRGHQENQEPQATAWGHQLVPGRKPMEEQVQTLNPVPAQRA